MRHSLPQSPQFYVTAPQPCPYLEGKVERKLFTALYGEDAKTLNDSLSQQGFRRSQNVLYRPTCAGCSACMSARIRAKDFSPSKSQKRVLRRNASLIREVKSPWANEEHYTLFQKYLGHRHADGGMADMDIFEFAAMIEETPVQSRVVEYYRETDTGTELVAACLTDVLEDGLSLVYSFFDPALDRNSLGSYIVLDHINMAISARLSYVYLGFWVPGSPKMAYKAKYRPLEVFRGSVWQEVENVQTFSAADHPLELDPVSTQVAAIHLPTLSEG
ncbi:MAG: arginyltransferase [Paracoccaceae bacterium]